ncbi:hypothetical protein AVEN_7709-1 [Araneus ventricosus]|uniref:Uncharacterized protein n=1 Tax=Araneus ventricosus TaxID=182803 RepID=A0A4Y2JLL5_ARAVE|nr:hypothetical protein AVEN_7709-1 [Araneus ventricosus]
MVIARRIVWIVRRLIELLPAKRYNQIFSLSRNMRLCITMKLSSFLLPVLKQHKDYFGTELVILNHGKMTKTDTSAGNPLSKLPHHINGMTLDPVRQAQYTMDLLWIWISNLKLFGYEAHTYH